MGLFNNYKSDEVETPKNEIVGTESRFILNNPVTLVLNDAGLLLMDEIFDIKDVNNIEYFKCKANGMNKSNKKYLYDIFEKPLLNIEQKFFSLKWKINIYVGDKQEKVLATLTKKNLIDSKDIIIEFFNQATDKKEKLELKCDYFSHSCGIFYGEEKGAPMICRIIRKKEVNCTNFYYVKIASGVDIALIVAIFLCFGRIPK